MEFNWEGNLNIVYFTFFIGAVFFSLLINSLLLKFSSNLGVRNLDESNVIRWSSQTKPSIGGITFYIVFLLSIATLSILPVEGVKLINRQLFGVFAASTLGFFIGLADDAYDTDPLLKFIGQLTCANILLAVDIYIPVSPSMIFNYIFTIVWVVGLMNSLNMLDNMDGVTGTVSLAVIAAAVLVVFQGDVQRKAYVFILYGMMAALIGFLYYNWHPSKMYMGDTGSQFLGIFLSAVSILWFWDYRENTREFLQIKQFLIPLMVFVMPIIDTTTVFIRRIAKGQSPFVGGKDHTTHQLAFLGISDGNVALIFGIMSFISVGITYLILQYRNEWTLTYSLWILGYFLILFIVMQILYEIGRKRYLARLARQEEKKAAKDTPGDEGSSFGDTARIAK